MTDWYIPAFRPIFPSSIWTGPLPHVYLTFDDGPHAAATPRALETLSHYDVRATFFLTGANVESHPDLAHAIAAAGHTIGCHGFAHRSYRSQSRTDVERDIRAGVEAIERVTGHRPTLFRPPYGRMWPTTPSRLRAIGLRPVLRRVNVWDYDLQVSSERIVSRSVRSVEAGDIVLLHDNEKSAQRGAAYLDGLLTGLTDRGFSFGCLT